MLPTTPTIVMNGALGLGGPMRIRLPIGSSSPNTRGDERRVDDTGERGVRADRRA